MSESVDLRGLRRYLDERQPVYLDLLQRMVAINSFTANAAGVDELGELTARAFASLGFQTTRVPSENPMYGSHLVLVRPGRSPRQIGLISHLDTVFPRSEELANDFAWRPAGDRIYGPGTVDIKGGTVMIYMILDALRRLAPDALDAVTWVILLDASEEVLEEDFGRLCLERLGDKTLACLVFEGGALADDTAQVVVARKGMAVYRVTVEGRASHAGSAHAEGANAVVQMADLVHQIDSFTDYGQQLTFNVGTMAGGTVTNRVPHFAAATVEMRAFDTAVFEAGVARMLAFNDYSSVRSPATGFPCRVHVELIKRSPSWPRNPATDRLLAVWDAAGRRLGLTVLPEERGGLSDGNHLWAQLPTIDGLGPAGGNAHCSERSDDGRKDQEYLLVPSLTPKASLNVLALLTLIDGVG